MAQCRVQGSVSALRDRTHGAGAPALGFQKERGVSKSRTPGPSCPLVDVHSFHRSPSAPSGKPPLCPVPLLEMLACSLRWSHMPRQAAHCAGSYASPGLCLHQLTFSDQIAIQETCP